MKTYDEYKKLFTEDFLRMARSKNTIRTYIQQLDAFFNYVNKSVEEITKTDVVDYINILSKNGKSSSTINLTIDGLNSFYKSLSKDFGLLTINPAQDVQKSKVSHREKDPLTDEEIDRMIACAKNERDAALIATLAETGLRVDELVNLKLTDFTERDEDDCFHVIGKGDKERICVFTQKAIKYIGEYIDKFRYSNLPYLFVSNLNTQMTEDSINGTLKNIANRAEITKHVSPHVLRASCATNLNERGVSVEVLKTLLGHSSINTTMIYTKIRKARMLDEINKATA